MKKSKKLKRLIKSRHKQRFLIEQNIAKCQRDNKAFASMKYV